MAAQVIVVAGPSGSGKSRLCQRLSSQAGVPFVNLDDLYRDGLDPTLPRLPGGAVDWDDPASWLREEAVEVLRVLCGEGAADMPVYDIARDGRIGRRRLDLGGAPYFLAEGIFAHEVVADCRRHGILADAVCVRNSRLVTFWRRLSRDLRERRKRPSVLVRRGLRLLREEPAVVRRAAAAGCVPMTSEQAFRRITARVRGTRRGA